MSPLATVILMFVVCFTVIGASIFLMRRMLSGGGSSHGAHGAHGGHGGGHHGPHYEWYQKRVPLIGIAWTFLVAASLVGVAYWYFGNYHAITPYKTWLVAVFTIWLMALVWPDGGLEDEVPTLGTSAVVFALWFMVIGGFDIFAAYILSRDPVGAPAFGEVVWRWYVNWPTWIGLFILTGFNRLPLSKYAGGMIFWIVLGLFIQIFVIAYAMYGWNNPWFFGFFHGRPPMMVYLFPL